MIVFIAGATGFIGRHLADALVARGHTVVGTSRRPCAPSPGRRWVRADFARDLSPADWRARLAGVEVVVNAVGILRESPGLRFDALHVAAPRALFTACVEAGVRRVVQVSALGADDAARSAYHLSKKAADDFLSTLPLSWVIVQPSLVHGPGGESARLFQGMAALPLVPLVGDGGQRVQPIHVDDLVDALVALVEDDGEHGRRLALVGPAPLTMRDFLGGLRRAMGLGNARFLPVPTPLVRMAAAAGRRLPGALLDADTLAMLERGNTADAVDTRRVLGRDPRPVEAFVPPGEAPAVRMAARLRWLLPVMRVALALMWIVTGIVSVAVYPVQESYALLARTGVPPSLQPLMLFGAGFLDILLGVAALLPWRPRALWLAQILLVLGYTVIITFRLPEFWLHPYGPILKNLPILAGMWLLLELDEAGRRRWNT